MFAVHSLEGWLINMSNPYKTRAGGATVTVFVPYDCNNHCPFCINKQEYEDCTGFSLEAILRSIRTMDEITPACDFVFTGGEPLMRKADIFRLCEKHRDIAFHAFTNGTLIDQAFCDELKRVGNFIVSVSIEGFEDANDGRRGAGHFEKALAVRRLEVSDLQNIGQRLADVDNADGDEHQRHIIGEGQRRHRSAEEERARVAHEDPGGMEIVDEEAEQSPNERRGINAELLVALPPEGEH